jgi:hypothetical protein
MPDPLTAAAEATGEKRTRLRVELSAVQRQGLDDFWKAQARVGALCRGAASSVHARAPCQFGRAEHFLPSAAFDAVAFPAHRA